MYIDISTDEKKNEVIELFKGFTKVKDIYDYYHVSDNSKNCKYVTKICSEIGFDKNFFREKRKKGYRYCLVCGKELSNNQEKFCSSSCSATYNNKKRKLSEETKKKISNGLNKYHELNDGIYVHGKERKKLNSNIYLYEQKHVIRRCRICGNKIFSGKCQNESCKHIVKFFDNLVCFGFKIESIGSAEAVFEYKKCVDLLEHEYNENLLSISQIKEKYCYPYSIERLVIVLKSLGIKLRSNSDSIKNAYKQGVIKPPINGHSLNFKTGWHTSWSGNKFYYRSSYELDFAEKLDKDKIDYSIEELRIEYYDTVKKCNRIAIPDFFIKKENKIIEVKSRFTFNKQNLIDKFKKYIECNYKPFLLLDGKIYSNEEIYLIPVNDKNIEYISDGSL